MTNPGLRRSVAKEICNLASEGHDPVVVHGGGPFIGAALKDAGIKTEFVRGLRVTTAESLPVIESVLTRLSKILAQDIGQAIGLSGRDSNLLMASVLNADLGFVGSIKQVNTALIENLLGIGLTPVIACLAENRARDDVLNVNADSVAGAVAGALTAPVILLTDVPGVLDDPSKPESLISELSAKDIKARIAAGRIVGGMIPKVESALEALSQGASFAVITDGRLAENIPLALMGKTGTRIYHD